MDDTTLQAFAGKRDQLKNRLSNEYIRGLIEGEGCFTFYYGWKRPNGRKYKVPGFVIGMNERDLELLKLVKDSLGLRNKIYFRGTHHITKSGKDTGRVVVLAVREFDQLKDIIIPLFYKKLRGYKGVQFFDWLEKIGSDPDISDRYKSLYRLYKWGMYDKLPKFTEKFKD